MMENGFRRPNLLEKTVFRTVFSPETDDLGPKMPKIVILGYFGHFGALNRAQNLGPFTFKIGSKLSENRSKRSQRCQNWSQTTKNYPRTLHQHAKGPYTLKMCQKSWFLAILAILGLWTPSKFDPIWLQNMDPTLRKSVKIVPKVPKLVHGHKKPP